MYTLAEQKNAAEKNIVFLLVGRKDLVRPPKILTPAEAGPKYDRSYSALLADGSYSALLADGSYSSLLADGSYSAAGTCSAL